jgi:hypothetical protein
MRNQFIATDVNGKFIFDGDTVIAEGVKHKMEFKRHREQFGCGHVYGYYIPDFAVLCKETETIKDETK